MTRRETLLAGAGAVMTAYSASAGYQLYEWGRIYDLPGSGGPRIAVLGEPPPEPRPTLLINYAAATGSLQPYYEVIASTKFSAMMREAGWTVCAVDAPCHSGCDRWPLEPKNLDGWAHRYANGRNLWTPPTGQVGYKQRASAGLDRLIEAGYVDPLNIWAAGFSRGGLLAAHYAAFDARVRGLALFHPVTSLPLLSPWFDGHPAPEAAVVEDVALLAPQLVGKPVYLTVNTWDATVNTDAAAVFTRSLVEAGLPTNEYVPDVTLRVQTVPGHTSPNSVYEEARAWLLERM